MEGGGGGYIFEGGRECGWRVDCSVSVCVCVCVRVCVCVCGGGGVLSLLLIACVPSLLISMTCLVTHGAVVRV